MAGNPEVTGPEVRFLRSRRSSRLRKPPQMSANAQASGTNPGALPESEPSKLFVFKDFLDVDPKGVPRGAPGRAPDPEPDFKAY
jgi:hypothetical protein